MSLLHEFIHPTFNLTMSLLFLQIFIVILIVIVIDQDESDARLLEMEENYKSEMKALKTDVVAWTEVSLEHMMKIQVICDIWFEIVIGLVSECKLISQNLRRF